MKGNMQQGSDTLQISSFRCRRAFLSYSHKDRSLVNTVKDHLKVLERNGALNIWSDRQLLPGEKFNESIRRNIKKCDFFVALISSNYLSSKYCMDIEFATALDRFGKDSENIIPIILRPCAWKLFPLLANLNALPQDGEPLSNFSDINYGCQKITESLNEFIYKHKNRHLEFDDSRVLWQLCGTENITKVGLRAVIITRLRILTKDYSLFAHRASADTRLIIESTENALRIMLSIEIQKLSQLLGVKIICLEGVDWNANVQFLRYFDGKITNLINDINDLLVDDSGAILLSVITTEEELASGGYLPHRLSSISINKDGSSRISLMFNRGNIRDDSIVATREEGQDISTILTELLIFDEKKVKASIHPFPKIEFMDQNFSKSLAGIIIFECDYLLKRIVTDFLSPKHEIGKKFWAMAIKNAGIDKNDTRKPLFFSPIISVIPEGADFYYEDNEKEYHISVIRFNLTAKVVGLLDPIDIKLGDSELISNLQLRNLDIDSFRKLGASGQNAFEEIVLPVIVRELNSGWVLEQMSKCTEILTLAVSLKNVIKRRVNNGEKVPPILLSMIDSNNMRRFSLFSEKYYCFNLGTQFSSNIRYNESAARTLFTTLGRWVTISLYKSQMKSLEACYYVSGNIDLKNYLT